MKRFVGLDGIKGLALIAIVLYHCMQQRLPGGFYGVDVFFTVSGFLIAVSLIRSLAKTGSLNLVRYIPKRAVRLYPALFLLIPVIVSVGWLFDHDILVSIRDQVITVLLGCYNWYAIAGGQSYFDQMNPQVFRHLWFIGVLMQFYVIVPFIVWLMWKLRQTKLSSLIPLGLAAFSSIAIALVIKFACLGLGAIGIARLLRHRYPQHGPDAGCGSRLVGHRSSVGPRSPEGCADAPHH